MMASQMMIPGTKAYSENLWKGECNGYLLYFVDYSIEPDIAPPIEM